MSNIPKPIKPYRQEERKTLRRAEMTAVSSLMWNFIVDVASTSEENRYRDNARYIIDMAIKKKMND